MRARRHALIVLLAVVAGPGCRALSVDPGRPPAVPPVPTVEVERIVGRLNHNAGKVQSLEAWPAVSDRRIGSASGRMALVRPRNFKLTIDAPAGGGQKADIGSNGREFWVWMPADGHAPKVTYVGRYDASGEPPPGLIVQPDWVIEALGLRILPPEEIEAIRVEPGTDPSTVMLVHTRPNGLGGSTIKKTLIGRADGLIRQHIFYEPDGKTEAARAVIDARDYKQVPTSEGESVVLPNFLRIAASPAGQEPLELRITLGAGEVKVNQFDESKLAIFEVPQYEGYAIRDVNQDLAPPTAAANPEGGRFDYETLPSPPTGTDDGLQAASAPGVQLGDPVPLGVDGATFAPGDPRPRTGDDLGSPGGIDAVLGQPIPRPPGS